MGQEQKRKDEFRSIEMKPTKAACSTALWTAKALQSYKVIIFDWDGTAVFDRKSDPWSLIEILEGVLRRGIICVVVTETSFNNVFDQAIRYISPLAKVNVYVCSNRGSEVYTFDELGNEKLLFRRLSTLEEDSALDRAIDGLKNYLGNLGLEATIVRDRLNRRKLDLIPIEPWKNPKKDQFHELLNAEQYRLKQSKMLDSFPTLMKLANDISENSGLRRPKLTFDIKHIEIGLTDKADSIWWVYEHIVQTRNILPNQTVVLGDEFGQIGDLEGSSSLMRISALKEATYISVGLEPEGVPHWVEHAGRGRQSLIGFLNLQYTAGRVSSDPNRSEIRSWGWREKDPSWLLEQEGFDPSREGELEPLFSIGNGYLGIRGSVSIPIPSSRGNIHLAGVYDRKVGLLPYSELDFMTVGRKEYNFAEIVTFPSVFQFRLRIIGQDYHPGRWLGETYQRDLSLGTGILFEQFNLPLRESHPGLVIRTSRLASLHNPHLLIQEIEFFTEGEDTKLNIDTSFEDPEHELRHPHLTVLSMDTGNEGFTELHEFNTQGSKIKVTFVTRTWCEGNELNDPRLTFLLKSGRSVVIRRLICAYTNRDHPNPKEQALDFIKALRIDRLSLYLYEHTQQWKRFWSVADLQFGKNTELTEAQRFNSYHLRIASGSDPRISIGARALTGNAYEGHNFWDTDIFAFPFLLHTNPPLAKNCLDYRYNTLSTARKRACEMGYEGACFAWESTVDGEDVTPTQIILKGYDCPVPIYTGKQQIHVTADIAFSAWNYWNNTQDRDWLWAHGLELLIETARFWASRVTLQSDTYHILKVVGPDEYHHDVDDNAYTNWIARFNLEKAIQLCKECQNHQKTWNEIASKLNLMPDEIRCWLDIADRLYFPRPNKDGVIEQFQGYFDLKDRKVGVSEPFKDPLDRLLSWDRSNQEQLIKQADVLMIPFLCSDIFSDEVLAANYHYYEPRTDHRSSLSPAVYAAIAGRIGLWKDCERYWNNAVYLDLHNLMNNTALGVHVGCMGGIWQSLVFHILGIKISENGISISSKRTSPIPQPWQGLKVQFSFREKHYQIQVTEGGIITIWPIAKEN